MALRTVPDREWIPRLCGADKRAGRIGKKIHDRMPLILPHEKIGKWIEPSTVPESLLPYALTDIVAERV